MTLNSIPGKGYEGYGGGLVKESGGKAERISRLLIKLVSLLHNKLEWLSLGALLNLVQCMFITLEPIQVVFHRRLNCRHPCFYTKRHG
jgi:hypothetical protein